MNNKEKPQKELLKEIEELKKENYRLSFLLNKNNTKHEQTNEALNENELSYRDMFEANPYPMWVFDIDTLHFLLVNDAAVEHYGYSREEFFTMTMKDIRPMEYLQYLHDSIAQATKKPGIDEILARHLKKGGTIIDVEITSHQITYKGRVARLIRTHDITERKRNEEMLVKLKKAVDTSGEAIFITDHEGIFKYVNPAFTALYGHTSEEIVGKLTPRIFKSGLMQPQDYEMFWKTLLSGQEVKGEIINKRKDGTILNIEGSATPILDEMNNTIGFLGIQRDITERKQVEEALRISEEKFREIFENNSSALAIIETDTTISMVNDEYCRISSYTKEEVTGMSWIQQVPPEDLERLKEYNRLRQINPKDVPDKYEFTFYHKNGVVKHALISISVLSNKNRIASFIDITDRKLAEEALRQSEQRMNFHVNNSPMATIEWNSGFIVTRWAGEAEKIFGWSQSETIGKSIMDIPGIYEEDMPIVQKTIERLTDGSSKHVVSTNRNYTKNGNVIYCEWYNSVMINPQGEMVSIMSQIMDITDRKQAEQALCDKVNELETFNSLMVDREIKMVELKKEINELLKKEGKDEKYEIFE